MSNSGRYWRIRGGRLLAKSRSVLSIPRQDTANAPPFLPLGALATPPPAPFAEEYFLSAPSRLRRGITTLEVVQSLLLTTLGVVATTDLPRVAALYRVAKQPLVAAAPAPNLLTSTLAAGSPPAAPFLPLVGDAPQRKRSVSADFGPNLPLSTLDFQPVAAAYPEFLAPQPRRPAVQDTSRGFNPAYFPAAAEAPFVPSPVAAVYRPRTPEADLPPRSKPLLEGSFPTFGTASLESPLRRLAVRPVEPLAAREIPARAEPFFPVDVSFSPERQRIAQSDLASSILLSAQAAEPPFAPAPVTQVWPRPPVCDTSQGSAVLYFPEVLRPFAAPPFDVPQQSRKRALDWTPGSIQPFLPQVFAPFAPVDVQRPLQRPAVRFELPPNLQPLFEIAPAVAPFAQFDWPAPAEWTFRTNAAAVEVFHVPVSIPAPLAGGRVYGRWILIEAAPRTLLVPVQNRIILVEASPRTEKS